LSAPLRIAVGVIVERRKASSPWIDFTWQAVSALDGQPDAAPWTVVDMHGDSAAFYAGAAEIALYPLETSDYRDNLATGSPSLWIALRPTGDDPPYTILAVTANPSEGESLTEAGSDLVDAVPMPETIRDVVARFVAEHHVERPFVKRKRDRADPDALARRAGPRSDRDR
jgi:hypothetical protein